MSSSPPVHSAPIAVCARGQCADTGQCGRTGADRDAETAGRDRRRGHWPGNGKRVAPAWCGSHYSGSTARVSSAADEQVAKEARKLLTRETGLVIQTGVKIRGISAGEGSYGRVCPSQDETEKLDVDKLIIAVGRVPNTAGLGAENVGLKMDERGYIEVDTAAAPICLTYMPWEMWCADPMLAHKASEEGVGGCRNDRGPGRSCEIRHHPLCYLHLTRDRLGGQDRTGVESSWDPIKAGQFPFMANGRAAHWARRAVSSKCWLMRALTVSWVST